MSKRIYLDYASVTPIDKSIIREVSRVAKKYSANPSSIYKEGVLAMEFLNSCRKRISNSLEIHDDEIIFTSGGTESNSLAILGVINAYNKILKGELKGVIYENILNNFKDTASHFIPHVISSTIEHPSIRELLFDLQKNKQIELTLISPNENGIIEPESVLNSLKENTIIVSVMYANNEIGTVMPISGIAKKIKEYKRKIGRTEFEMPFLHSDASQAVCYLPMRLPSLHADLLTIDGGKIYGPRGIGALYVKRIVPFASINKGGSQEGGRRAGTENLPSIAGFALALENVEKNKKKEFVRVEQLRDLMLSLLSSSKIKDKFFVNGSMQKGERLPNNLNICIPGVDAEFLVLTLDALGVCASSVTSCRTLSEDSYSYVVQEIAGEECSKSSLRLSLGRSVDKREIVRAVKIIVEAVERIFCSS